MATPKNKDTPRITPEQYLEQERASLDQKHEYVDGEIFAMVGASEAHILILLSIASVLRQQTKGSPCRTYASDLKIRTEDNGIYAYPDIVVVCGKREFHDEKRDIVLNPKVIIEVLSPSTEQYDRTKKFFWYQQIKSLQDCLFVSQEEPLIEIFSRHNQEREWLYQFVKGLDSNVLISSIGCTLELSEVYDRVWEDI